MSVITPSHLGDALRGALGHLDGDLQLPGHPGWDAARASWNLAVDQHPVAVVHAGSAADVAATVLAASRLGLQVAAQATGHAAGVLDDLDHTILVRTDRLGGVEIDPAAMIARVGAGVRWGQVSEAAARHGLAALAGSSPDVGVVGYTLGGGLGWLSRSHGLAANSVTAIELVTADGRARRVAERPPGQQGSAQQDDEDADLWWALRGGGGAPGVVTAIEFRLYPVAEVHAGALWWPIERAHEVAHAWRQWIGTVPTSVTSHLRLLRLPPLPDLPEFLQGRSLVKIEAALQETTEEADRILMPLRALAPQLDTFDRTPVARLAELHMDPPGPIPVLGDGAVLRSLDRATIDAFLRAAGPDNPAAAPLLSAEIRHLGGELSPQRGEGGAIASVAGEGIFHAVGIAPPPAAGAVAAAVTQALAHLETVRAETDCLNFAETRRSPQRLFGASLERLRRITQSMDPAGVIRAQHSLWP
ncbi:FAD-binding oxidoreductase [Acidipropionibacterium jensenii]|uniref:FAD-binding oxidoreductase n=1 Tax=Acidipropionibacterium jensenii TaxID=1749 RepID=UPI00214B6319|nr:FAD-binding oxidoreductase [Acidipropionibacterium jensenii]